MKILIIILTLLIFNSIFSSLIRAESFTWPSNGYLEWRFYQDTNGGDKSGIQVNINGTTHYMHTGIDIWSNLNGDWNSDGGGNTVYSAYSGQISFVDTLGLQVKHRDGLYTNYWHLKNIAVSNGDTVDMNTILGYQDVAGGAVHVHVTVSTTLITATNGDNAGAIDPSPYFATGLDVRNADIVPAGTQVTHTSGNNCNQATVIINQVITGNKICSATNLILMQDGATLSGEQHYYIN